jgi:hypothetical protein
MRRFRFQVPGDDGRSLTFPPEAGVGPYGETGWTVGWTFVVAYAPSVEAIKSRHNWPDAVNIDDLGEQEIRFTDRFAKPRAWNEALQKWETGR